MTVPADMNPVTAVVGNRVVADRRVVGRLVTMAIYMNPVPRVVIDVVALYYRGHGSAVEVRIAINTGRAAVDGVVRYG